jgi:hypothetical protein
MRQGVRGEIRELEQDHDHFFDAGRGRPRFRAIHLGSAMKLGVERAGARHAASARPRGVEGGRGVSGGRAQGQAHSKEQPLKAQTQGTPSGG